MQDSSQARSILDVVDLSFAYPGRELFKCWSGSIPPGVTLVQGGDGRGKTTLLRLFAGAQAAAQGRLVLDGMDLAQQPAAYRAKLFWTEARSEAFDEMTAPQYFDSVRRAHAGFDDAALARLVEGLGLEPHLHKQLFMLSTGSKRKVWIAAAFASMARLTLIDEPFAALDGPSIAFITGLLQQASRDSQRAIVIADYSAPAEISSSGLIDLGD